LTELPTYRLANYGDVPGIAALHTDNWRTSYRGNFRDEYLDGDIVAERQAVWKGRLENPAGNQYVWVAVQHQQVVGFVCAFASHDREWGSFIDNLHVDARSQGNGIGSALMRRCGDWLRLTCPTERVYLLVWQFNRARALYERLGGRNAGIVEVENPGGGIGRYFRFVWERPDGLLGSTGET